MLFRSEVATKAAASIADEMSAFVSEIVRQSRSMLVHGSELAIQADDARDFRDAAAGWAIVHEGGRKALGLDRFRDGKELSPFRWSPWAMDVSSIGGDVVSPITDAPSAS